MGILAGPRLLLSVPLSYILFGLNVIHVTSLFWANSGWLTSGDRRVRLPGEPVEPGERLERLRLQPQQRGVRHPAGAARLEDGQRRPGLAEQRGDPDPVGPGLHQVAVRLALRRVGALAVDRLVLAAGPC